MQITPQIQLEARKELARRYFLDYCRLRYPTIYAPERLFLDDLCTRLQTFIEQNDRRFLLVNIPPRHFKSLTGSTFVEWLFGRRPERKVMTGSYNETLSTTFARKVRNTIDERKAKGDRLVYHDIFPDTRVKYGQASASLWALEGTGEDSYLATSPGGTATGFGANILLIDDIIKNAEEAYNELVLDKHWDWFTNTMMQRTEGDDWKVIVIMTRWATGDLAGRILEAYDDVEHVTYTAVQPDGSMLCEPVLNYRDYQLKTQEMNTDIVEANYNQRPIDITGRLYSEFLTYDAVPWTWDTKRWNYTDTADTGSDFLCSVNWVEIQGEVYVLDVAMTDEAMERSEPQVADMLDDQSIDEAVIESNNGGRGFARNIGRLLLERSNKKCVVTTVTQTGNKEARILASSAWVVRHVHMPSNWKTRWPEFHKQLYKYQKRGRNAHDDAPDVLAAIYEQVTGGSQQASTGKHSLWSGR